MSEETTVKTERNFLERLGHAVLAALVTVLYVAFALPYKLWEHAVNDANTQSISGGISETLKTDLPLMNSYVKLWNSMIVVLPFIMFIFMVIIMPMISYRYGFGDFLAAMIFTYYSPMFAAAIREFLYLSVSIANNLKKIAESK